jgi:hypothetical protein
MIYQEEFEFAVVKKARLERDVLCLEKVLAAAHKTGDKVKYAFV